LVEKFVIDCVSSEKYDAHTNHHCYCCLIKVVFKIYVYEKYLIVILLFKFFRVIFISDSFNFDIDPDPGPAFMKKTDPETFNVLNI